MNFEPTAQQALWRDRVASHIADHIRHLDQAYRREQATGPRWKVLETVEQAKAGARDQGLWNLFMPPGSGHAHVDDSFAFKGPGLTNLEYALCAEEMGRIAWSSEVFNCSAPDTGNM